jgi:serine protease Do
MRRAYLSVNCNGESFCFSIFRRCAVFTVFILLFMRGIATGADTSSSIREQIDRAIARVKPALVRIRVVSDEYRDGREVKVQEVGSGAIITKDGYLITNHHVAGHAARMFCTLWNREEIEADLVGTDPLTDIAVLKLRPEKPRTFTSAVFGDSSRMRVGDTVLAMGSPMALSQSVTLGILSNTEMVMPAFFGPGGQFRLDGEDVGSLVRWFAHDAAIYGGNSGGPLINLNGEIVGINEISYGLSGAIPGNLARTIAMELIVKPKRARAGRAAAVQAVARDAWNFGKQRRGRIASRRRGHQGRRYFAQVESGSSGRAF